MDPRNSLGSFLWLVVVTLCIVTQSSASAQPAAPDGQTLAREAYAAGVAAFQQGDHVQALVHFAAADEAFPSPNVKLMLGRTLLQLDRKLEAYASLAAAVRDARSTGTTRYEQAANAASEELQRLAPSLATISLRVEDPTGRATLRVGDQEIPREAWADPIAAEPGEIDIVLTGPDGQRDAKQVEMPGGGGATLSMVVPTRAAPVLAEAPAPSRAAQLTQAATADSDRSQQLRLLSYVAAGVGTGGIVAFGVLGAMSNSQFSDLETSCPDRGACNAGLREHATRGQTYQTLANVSLGIGLSALAAGVVLWVVGLPGERSQLALSARGIQLTGAF
jgi:hypothetical protein